MLQLGEKKVSDYMTRVVVSVDDTDKLTNAIRIMDERRISALPVVDNQNAVVGILTTSDLTGMFHEVQSDLSALHLVTDGTKDFLLQMLTEQGDNTRVSDVMTSPVETTSAETNLVSAAQILNDKPYHHLLAVDENHCPIGILATSDFVRAIAEVGSTLSG